MEDADTRTNETNHDEEQRRKLQEYIFDLEKAQDKTDALSTAHRELKLSQDLLLSLLRGTIHGICLIRDCKFVWCNEAFKDIFGWEQDELIGETTEIIYPNFEEHERMRKVAYGDPHRVGLITYEYDYLHRDGHGVPCLVTVCPLDQNDPAAGHVFSFSDVTEQKRARESLRSAYGELVQRNADLMDVNEELNKQIRERKRAEEALQQSEQRYRRIFKNIQDVYYESSLDGVILEISPSIEKGSQYKRKELIGKSLYDIYTHPKERDKFLKRILNKGRVDDFEILLTDKNGSKRPCSISTVLLKDEQGNPVKLVGSMRDISERKRSEDKRKKLEAKLQHAQKMEAVGTLAGGVAHDLNNILGGIVGYPELLLLRLPENSPLREPILAIQKSGERAAAVVLDLLTLARRGVVGTEVVNLNDVISEYLKSPEYKKLQSYHPDVHLETHLDQNTFNILGSFTHLSKTIMNLVSNATEAMSEGGALTVSTENRYIDRPIKGYGNVEEGHYVVITISDMGTGISPADIEKIFEPFYTKKKMGKSGTGLGMAIVWGTVKDHNGYIDVQSTEGKGTTFTLYFPVTRKESSQNKSHLTIESYNGSGESILIVDDVNEQRQIASDMLKTLGYSVISVSSGEKAVEYLKTHKIDLLVLDMIMPPGMDGLDTYKKILELHPGQKAIIASGFPETNRINEVQRLGAGAYIKKPFLLEKIGIAVKETL